MYVQLDQKTTFFFALSRLVFPAGGVVVVFCPRFLQLRKLPNGNFTLVHEGFLTALDNILPHVKRWVDGYILGGGQGMRSARKPPVWRFVFFWTKRSDVFFFLKF